MNNRLWIGAALLLAGGIFWGVGQAVGPSSGDTELEKALDAVEHVKSFHGAYTASASSGMHSERLWDVDCNRVIVHQQSHDSQGGADSAFEMKEEQVSVGTQRYMRDRNGSWENAGTLPGDHDSAQWYCTNIARGIDRDLLPDVRTMLHHAMTEKGDKKIVNGAHCREWKFDMRTAVTSQKGSICIGVDDHLPYEMTLADGHYSYSDYNQPIQIDVPEAALQPASATSETN